MTSLVDMRCSGCTASLEEAFAAIERGELGYRIDERASLENPALAMAFNRMAERLEAMTADARQTLDESRRTRERERMIAEAVGLGAWRLDLDAMRIGIDPNAQPLRGQPGSYEQHAEDFNARVHPDDIGSLWSRIDDYLRRGLSRYEAEFRVRHRDGSWRWIAAFGRLVERDAQGRPRVLAGAYRDVTDERLARAEIEAQQRFIATLSGNVPGLLHRLRVGHDGALSFGFVGRNAGDIMGVEADAFTPERLLELVRPEMREATVARLMAELATGTHAEVEYEVVLPDGRARSMRCVADLVARDAEGADWNGILFDITAEVEHRRELERARREAEAAAAREQQALAEARLALERERVANEAIGLGVWWYDMANDVVRVDERLAQMVGETPESFGQTIDALNSRVHPDDLDLIWTRVTEYLEHGRPRYEAEYRLRHRDGSWRWIASFGVALERDAQGRPLVLGGAHRDVTDQYLARADLETQQRLITTLSGNVPAVLHRIRVARDGALSFGFVGRNARDLLGVDADRLGFERLVAMMTPETREAAIHRHRADVATGTRSEIEFDVALPDGRIRSVRCVSNLVARDADGADWDGILFDVTDAVAQRRELEQARRAAEAASDAKSAFLAAMSHELRTPLTGVLGYAQLIERRARDAAVVPLAQTIRTSAERMRALLNDILDTARIEAGAMSVEVAPMTLAPLVREVAELFRPAVDGKGLALAIELGGAGDVTVAGDATRARQVLVNLLSNAVKFTERGGITVSLHADDEAVRVRVADTGPGVPEGFHAGVFERFRQANADVARQHGGTGLGLALSRDFARLMGGGLRLCDGDGPGATFEFRLPRLVAGAVPGDAAQAGAQPHVGR